MSSIVLSGDTSGAITIAAPAVAGTNTLTLPANTGTLITTATSTRVIPNTAVPAGSVIQVVNATFGTQTSTASSTFVDTGITVSITPTSSTSKILVDANVTGLTKGSGGQVALQLVRNSTSIVIFESGAAYTSSGSVEVGGASCNYLDSPATTSATTYKVQFLSSGGGTAYVCNNNGTQTATCTITVMEIAV
jgi:hypothetical protein